MKFRQLYSLLLVLFFVTDCSQDSVWKFYDESKIRVYQGEREILSGQSTYFGTVNRGETSRIEFTIYNLGAGSCTINSITSTSSDFVVSSYTGEILGGGTAGFEIDFTPRILNAHETYITISSSDSVSPEYTFRITGYGTYTPVGELDSDFGTGGMVTISNATGSVDRDEVGNDFLIDENNRIIVAGYSVNNAAREVLAIWGFSEDGSIDTTFGDGNDGSILDDGTIYNYSGNGIALDSENRIVISGYSKSIGSEYKDIAIWRFLSDGVLRDGGFEDSGLYKYDYNNDGSDDSAFDLVIDSTGDIIVTGSSEINDYSQANTLKVNTLGELIDSWDTNETPILAAGGSGSSIAIDENGNILICGYIKTDVTSDEHMAVFRYNSGGSLDASFGNNNGYYMYSERSEGLNILLDHDGNIYVAGVVIPDMRLTIWKLTSNGTLDTTWDSDGIVTNNEYTLSTGNKIDACFDSTGSIIICCAVSISSQSNIAVWRYTNSGTLDTDFGSGGIYSENFIGNDGANAIAMDRSGNLVVTGYRTNSNLDMILFRLK